MNISNVLKVYCDLGKCDQNTKLDSSFLHTRGCQWGIALVRAEDDRKIENV